MFFKNPNITVEQKEENQIIELSWSDSFILKEKLKYYEVKINNKAIYKGNKTQLLMNFYATECISNNSKDIGKENMQNGYASNDLVLIAVTQFHSIESPKFKIISNCSSKIKVKFQ